MTSQLSKNSKLRQAITLAALVVCLIILGQQAPRLSNAAQINYDDFIEYWAAGKLNLSGANPYDPDQLGALQETTGRTMNYPLMMWNPPWTLPLVMPFGLFGYSFSRLLWFMLHLLLMLMVFQWLWVTYGGQKKRFWAAWLFGLTFVGTIQVFKLGQITPLLLLSSVGFLYFIRQQKWWQAGAVLSLALIKPQLLYLLCIAVLLWVIQERRWQVLAGTAAAATGGLAASMVTNPNVIAEYLYAATHFPPKEFITPTLGAALRLAFGFEKVWLQFLPIAFGTAWLVWYWMKRRHTWDWSRELPLVCAVSMVTSAYGWIFDQILLLPAMFQVMVMVFRPGKLSGKITIFAAYLAPNILPLLPYFTDQHQFWWLPTYNLLWYLASRYYLTRKESSGSPAYMPSSPARI